MVTNTKKDTTYKSITRIFDILEYQRANYPLSNSINAKKNGKWISYSTEELLGIIDRYSAGLLSLNIQKGDAIAIISKNRPEWAFIDFAVQQIGAFLVPIYTTSSLKDYSYILEHCDAKLIFVEDREVYEKVRKASTSDISIYTFEEYNSLPNCSLLCLEGEEFGKYKNLIKEKRASIKGGDLATIIYTSGTMGVPKGVILTHNNIVKNVLGIDGIIPLRKGEGRILSFLPVAHVYERTVLYAYMFYCTRIYYGESLVKVGDNIREIKPYIFTAVPRLLEKIYNKIVSKGSDLKGISRSLFFWALNLGLSYNPHEHHSISFRVQLWIARVLIFSKWKKALGGNIRMIISGGAPLPPYLGKIFWAAGLKICEGYGQTETSPIISVSSLKKKDIRIGTTGLVIKTMKVKIADDGEILCGGPCIMKGYYKDSENTEKTIKNGWLHTGDLGTMIEGKFLKVTGRKKQLFKTSAGKYVSSQLIEEKLRESNWIEECMVLGEGKDYITALIVPDFESADKWAEDNNISYTDISKILKSTQFNSVIHKEVKAVNSELNTWERLRKFTVLQKRWTIEDQELTPKLSVKREVILSKYKDEIDSMY